MSKEYGKKTSRSRRKPAKDLEGHVRDLDIGEGTATVQLSLPISEVLLGDGLFHERRPLEELEPWRGAQRRVVRDATALAGVP